MALATLIVFGAFAADRAGWLAISDLKLADLRVGLISRAPQGSLTLVDIDAKSLNEIGVWPFSRERHAELLRQAGELGARTVAFDIDFSAASEPAADRALAEALSAGPQTLLASFAQPATVGSNMLALSMPAAPLLDVSWPAAVNVPIDADGRVRRFTSRIVTNGETVSSMPALLADREPAGENFGIDLSIDPQGFERVSYVDLLKGRADPALIEGRDLIVGATATELRDFFQVPRHGIVSGSTIIAMASETLAQGRAVVRPVSPLRLFAVIALFALGVSALARARLGLFLLALGAGVVEAAAVWLYHSAALSLATAGLHLILAAFVPVAVFRAFDLRTLLLKLARLDLDNSRAIFERVVEDSFDAILLLDENGTVLRANEAARAMPLGEAEGLAPSHLHQLPDALRRAVELSLRGQADEAEARGDARATRAGREHILEYTVALLKLGTASAAGEGARRVCVTLREVTQIRQAHERIAFMAMNDSLTGLANRRALDEASARAAETGAPFAFLMFDLDRFKTINDTLGHRVGDEVLRETARRAALALGPDALLARTGGDEFCALLSKRDARAAAQTAQALSQSFREPVPACGHQVGVGLSIGIALGESAGGDPRRAMQQADMALHHIKRSQASGVRFALFQTSMETKRMERLALEGDLSRALASNEMRLVYQPQVDLRSGRLSGAEALLRWHHPQRGPVSPAVFVPIAEECGLIEGFGAFAMEAACRDAMTWTADIPVAVNVSSVQFAQPGLLGLVDEVLARTGLPARRLELEITETAFARESETLLETFHAIRRRGIGLALDDFGTGYSSLSYLHRFPVTKIKIDKSFVDGLPHNGQTLSINRSILALAGALDLKTIAEGIETPGQAESLKLLGCREGQGYLFSRPIEADAMRDFDPLAGTGAGGAISARS